MAEILYGGERKDNGKWVYGYSIKRQKKKIFIKCEHSAQYYEVFPRTVRQYICLKGRKERHNG